MVAIACSCLIGAGVFWGMRSEIADLRADLVTCACGLPLAAAAACFTALATATDAPGAVTLTMVAGYGAAADVPYSIRQAILLMVAHWFVNREAASPVSLKELPLGVAALLSPYRRTWLF